MRGRKVYDLLTADETPQEPTRKGRNHHLVDLRNECLVARFYYFSVFSKKCYEDILNRLGEEFFLTQQTIVNVLQEHADAVGKHRKEATTLYHLRAKWPHLKWW
jgi:hypothetical protein